MHDADRQHVRRMLRREQFHASGAAVTSHTFILTNFGLKVWKHTGTGTIYLDSVKYDYAAPPTTSRATKAKASCAPAM